MLSCTVYRINVNGGLDKSTHIIQVYLKAKSSENIFIAIQTIKLANALEVRLYRTSPSIFYKCYNYCDVFYLEWTCIGSDLGVDPHRWLPNQ